MDDPLLELCYYWVGLLHYWDLLTDPERAKTDGEASFIRWAGLFLSIPASVNDKGRGLVFSSYPVAELFFAPGGPLRVLSTLLFMEEPTPRDKASARGYEAFVRYKRFIGV